MSSEVSQELLSCDDIATSIVSAAEAPTRRRPYFLGLADPASSPPVTRSGGSLRHTPSRSALQRPADERSLDSIRFLDMRELGPRRDASTLLRSLLLFTLALSLVVMCALMTAIAASSSAAGFSFGATLIAGAGALLSAEVLAEELEFFLVAQTPRFMRTRHWWERLRRRVRELAGGATALSFGPYR